jgi:hypothetical protein
MTLKIESIGYQEAGSHISLSLKAQKLGITLASNDFYLHA